ncbi:restriction endonuclease subunit S [Pseudomonas sp. ML2-2023-3]|uniref:restriction endonuclease subunit S n=1 Tax=Pseudomonas sp. ML2-2023-3 TaxID=3122375 RepID=UPI0030D0684D
MRAGWQKKTLIEACHFSNGLWKGEKEPFVNVGVIRNTNFTKDGALDDSDIAYLDVEAKKFEKRRLQFGDIILEKSGGGPKQPVGRVVLFDKQEGLFSFSNFTSALRIKDPQELDFRFLHKLLYWTYLCGITEKMQSHSTGIRNLDGNAYKAIEISFPALAEQRRIAAILDEALAGIATACSAAEQNRQNSRALFDSCLQDVFSLRGKGWQEKPLSELCNIKHGFAFKSEFFTDKGDHILLTPGNFYESGGYRDRGVKQKYYCGDIPTGFILEKNDLLVAMTEQAAGLLGSPILVPEPGRFLHNQRLGLVTPKTGVPWLNEFFFHVFNTQAVRKAIHGSASGVKVRHTSPTKIGEVVVAFPSSVDEQRCIVSKLEEIQDETRHLEALYQRKLEALDELKRSLLHHAFSGNL